MKTLKLVGLAALIAIPAFCARTTVTDTLYNPSGTKFTGSMYLTSSTTFVASDGNIVSPSQLRIQVTNGIFSIPLEPNDTGVPSGTSYVVTYQLNGGLPLSEVWVVPTSGSPIGLASVRTINPPAPGFIVALSQLSSSGAVAGNCIVFSTSWGLGGCGSGVGNNMLSFRFTSQTPGTTLTASTPATVPMAPCPNGVNGSDSGHWYYLSGGTGTAEAVLGTGGTCTSGASTGTLIFTPANNHSGAWTIGPANSGCQEAVVNALAGGGPGQVFAPGGTFPFYAPCTIAGNLILSGAGYSTTVFQAQTATQDIVDVTANAALAAASPVMIRDIQFNSTVLKTAGVAINISTPAGTTYNGWSEIENCSFGLQFISINLNNSVFARVHDNIITGMPANSIGIQVSTPNNPDTGGASIYRNQFVGGNAGTKGVRYVSGGGMDVTKNKFVAMDRAFSGEIASGAQTDEVLINDNQCDQPISYCYYIQPVDATALLRDWTIENGVLVGAPTTAFIYINSNGSALGPFIISGQQLWQQANIAQGIQLVNGTEFTVIGNHFHGFTNIGISVAAAVTNSVVALNPFYGAGSESILSTSTALIDVAGGSSRGLTQNVPVNYFSTETGSNNNPVINGPALGFTVKAGLCVQVQLAHTLQAGANTFSLDNGSTFPSIKSHLNPANNIATGYAATGVWTGCYNGTVWLDMSQ